MKSPNNAGDRAPVGPLLSPNKDSALVLGYIYLSCWPFGSPGNRQITQTVAKTIGCYEIGRAHV